ncbi:MAG: nucleoid-associated protein [Bacteroidaceae bacterium]|nr:nucleoid-associated protein [Bacteroidaceae bacterium]
MNPAIESLALHWVGNQSNDEQCITSSKPFALTQEMNQLLTDYFIGSFKSGERYNFSSETGDLSGNFVYKFVSNIFDNPDMLLDFSVDLATQLYECCDHPQIKGGDFYVVRFSGCSVGNEECDAIGLFKIENKDLFLTIEHDTENKFDMSAVEGISLKKVDKGCLVLNYERQKGYYVMVVDNSNKSNAQYWVDDFLHLSRRQDAYFQTENMMHLCRNYLIEQLPQDFQVSRADQVDLLNKSMNYFAKSPKFDNQTFQERVLAQPELTNRFNNYRQQYEQDRDIDLGDNFDLNPDAVKKEKRAFKSVIKLDKNFHIYIHGNRDLIEAGTDEKGKFYKLYFNSEG